MGFLNNTTVTVDAILTKKGRELLAQGTDAFNITKFALSDDEVDYNLWDTTHPNGTDSYGAVIENMPLLEASPDENHAMRYKLVTLPKNTQKMLNLRYKEDLERDGWSKAKYENGESTFSGNIAKDEAYVWSFSFL